jgi:hypothetical protein
MGSYTRPLFLLGCVFAGWFAWSKSPGEHLQAALFLFSFTPFVRRLVDLSAGFDPGGLMIAGPLLALLVCVPELRKLAVPGRVLDGHITMLLVFGACVAYCAALTAGQGNWSQAATGSLKWGAPLLFAMALYLRQPNARKLVHDAAAAFAVILPVTGLYAIYQYVDPPMWDRYWLLNAPIPSAGLPEPYEVRVFSTMHAPASFAAYTATGLLLVYLLHRGWLSRVAMIPAVIAFALSLSRSHWMSLAASLSFCLLYSKTRASSGAAFAQLTAGIVICLLFTSFGDVIVNRASTFAHASDDSSGLQRAGQFAELWNEPNSRLTGIGFNAADVEAVGAVPTDGVIVACWRSMGLVVGLIYIAALIYVILFAIALASRRSGEKEFILLAALMLGWLVQLPLASITSGESGFLFWTTATLAMSAREPPKR